MSFHTRPVPLRRTNRAQEGTRYLCGAHYTDPNVLHHRGALMRDNTATDGAASGAANSIHLTKPLNDPAQSSRDPERPKTGGVAAVGVCPGGEGGVHQWGHCVMSPGSLSLLLWALSNVSAQSSLFLKNGAHTHPRCFQKANTILFALFGQMGRDLWSVHVRTQQHIFQMCD